MSDTGEDTSFLLDRRDACSRYSELIGDEGRNSCADQIQAMQRSR